MGRTHHYSRASLRNLPTVDLMFSVLVPAPRHLTLERQLNKSVLIGWTIPEPPSCHQIESYHVYVDGVLKVTVKANERTRALVEGVDCNRVNCFAHNFVRSVQFICFYLSHSHIVSVLEV